MKKYVSKTLIVAIFLMISVPQLAGATSLDIWIRAFIPNPDNAGSATNAILSRPGGQPGSIVTVAAQPTYCFLTDNRGVSNAIDASSRMDTRFRVTLVDEFTAVVSPLSNRVEVSSSTEVDCETGEVIKTAEGKVNLDAVGNPAVADGLIQIIGQSQGTNTIPVFGLGPSIDYSFDVLWNPKLLTLRTKISYSKFPAMELYARQGSGDWKTILSELPSGSPWTLVGDGLGVGTVRKESTDSLAD